MPPKKPKKKKKSVPAPALSQDEAARLTQLLSDLKDIDPARISKAVPSPTMAQAFLEQLPVNAPEAVNLVLAIGKAYDHKAVQKAVKKILFKLRQKGVSVPESPRPEKTPGPFRKIRGEDPAAYLGPPDGMGYRAVFLAVPKIPKGVDVGLGIISDEEGITEFLFGRYSKKQTHEVKEIFFQQTGPLVQTSLSHAATILERAYSRNKTGPDETTSGYLQLRPWIQEHVTLLDRSVVYDLIPPERVAEIILTPSQIDTLLDHEFMASWLMDPDELKPLVEDIIKAEESPILISADQKADRIKEIKEKGVHDLYPESKRRTLKGRLEEMSYVLLKLGEEDHARLALASALSLEGEDSSLRVNLFLKCYLERSLDYILKEAGDMGDTITPVSESSPNIIIP